MTVTEEQKKAIQKEYDAWVEVQYAGKNKKERQKLGQFFTPPVLSIKMLEKFDTVVNKTILDPTIGCGGLIAAAILAGANPKMCYGIELDPNIAKLCRERLGKLGVPEKNIKVGNALDQSVYDSFEEPELEETNLFLFVSSSNEDYLVEAYKDSDMLHPAFSRTLNHKALDYLLKNSIGKPVWLVTVLDIDYPQRLSFHGKESAIKSMLSSNLDRFKEIAAGNAGELKVAKSIVQLAVERNLFEECF